MTRRPFKSKASSAAESTTLTTAEQARFAELEVAVDRGMMQWLDVGVALAEIRDGKLYRDDHGTFEKYLKSRWDMSSSRGYEVIEASQVFENVRNCGHSGQLNIGQTRELAKVEPERQAEVLERAAEQNDGRVTAKAIKAAASPTPPDVPTQAPDGAEPKLGVALPPVEDCFGNPLPEGRIEQAKLDGTAINKVASELARLRKQIAEAFESQPGFAFLPLKAIEIDLKNAAGHLRDAKFHCLCPVCKGRGCKQCEDQGWQSAHRYKRMPEETRWEPAS